MVSGDHGWGEQLTDER